MQKLFTDQKYWLDRAEELRAIAEQLTDLRARSTMLGIAADCDRLAAHAARHAASDNDRANQAPK